MTQLAPYRSIKARYWEDAALIVAGDTVDDFCLYYCLSRLRKNVNWLLPTWVNRFDEGRKRAQSGGARLSGEELTAMWFFHELQALTRYSNDMAVPLLALDYLRRKADDSFLYSNELEFYKPKATKPLLESDLCCIPSGVLTVGEAKKGNRLGENAEDEAAKIQSIDIFANCLRRDKLFLQQWPQHGPPPRASKSRKLFLAGASDPFS